MSWRGVPSAYVTRHFHPLAIVVCVLDGALGFAIHHGAATLTRGGTGETPEATEPLALDIEVVLEPRDCISFDEFAAHTIHSAWNASDGTTVSWETDLVKTGEPFTTFVNAQGTPVPKDTRGARCGLGGAPPQSPRTAVSYLTRAETNLRAQVSSAPQWNRRTRNAALHSGRDFPRRIIRREPQDDWVYLFS